MSGKKLLFQIIKHFHGALSNGYYLRKLLPFVLMAMLLPCQSAVALRKRPPQEDACPNTLRGPGNDLVLPYITHNGIERQCCACNPGYRLEKLCEEGNFTSTVCVPCEPNTYITDFAHGRATCDIDDLICPDGLIKIPSEPDTAPRCDCSQGYFKSEDGKCVNHTPCPPGLGVKVRGSPFRDTECEECLFGYESPYDSTTHTCTLKKSIFELYKNATTSASIKRDEQTTTARSTSVTPVTTDANHKYQKQGPSVFFVGLIVLLSSIIFLGVAVHLWRCYQKKKDTSCSCRGEDPEAYGESEEPLRNSSAYKKSRHSDDSETESDDDCTRAQEIPSDERPEKNTSSPCNSTDRTKNEALQRSSRGDGLYRSTSDQTPNSYRIIMNYLKLALADNMDEPARNRMFRHFTCDKPEINHEIYLSDLKYECRYEERFCALFEKLKQELGEEKFHPYTLYDFFCDDLKNLSLAEIVKRFLPIHSSG